MISSLSAKTLSSFFTVNFVAVSITYDKLSCQSNMTTILVFMLTICRTIYDEDAGNVTYLFDHNSFTSMKTPQCPDPLHLFPTQHLKCLTQLNLRMVLP
jgi:hypothetical protein